MISASDRFRSLGYTLKDDNTIKENATCCACQKSAVGSPAYTCSASDDDSEPYYLHKTCSEFPLFLDFHVKHPLRLKEDIIIGEDAACCVCTTSIRGSPTYTCCSRDVVADCENFYLHKSCAELPKQIDHHKHNIHPLSLLPRPDDYSCDICRGLVKFSYACVDCDFDVCVLCAFEQRELHHEGHKEHTLTLMKQEALFKCDACYERSEDSSYVCTICEFWIHKSCALSPSIIPAPTYHHHPLTLIYSIPNIHRFFRRFCGICRKHVSKNCWLYYCHKCTYFVHMKCSTSTVPMVNETEEDETDEPDSVQFPLPSQEAIFDLIVTQCGKFQVDFEGEVVNSITISTSPSDPDIIENHWSHENHPLQKLQFTISENDENDSDDDREAMICDGCIQPITVFQPSYYACIQCGFFLHSFCATKLPHVLPVGASTFHPNHSLLLAKSNSFYSFVNCGVCCAATNGFYYSCQTCDIYIDIRCAFLPKRIKHKSHKHHSFVQRLSSESTCSITSLKIDSVVEYACETCNSFQIHIYCAIFPGTVEHRYDVHDPITLRYPPFFYEGVFYCEICEEQVNNQELLYHCSKSDHSYHYYCLSFYRNMKLGGTIDVTVLDKPHTLTLVVKLPTRKNPTYTCSNCSACYDSLCLVFECDGCGYLLCCKCAVNLFHEYQGGTP